MHNITRFPLYNPNTPPISVPGRVLPMLLALLLTTALPLAGQKNIQPRDWQQGTVIVAEIVQDLKVDGSQYITKLPSYDPKQRIIHDQGTEVDYPISFDLGT